jgi:hypothetical protein
MSVALRPLVETPRQRELRERRARVKVRAAAVERAGLDACVKCGGTVEFDKPMHLHCDCEAQVASLVARMQRLAGEHIEQPNLVDVIAP